MSRLALLFFAAVVSGDFVFGHAIDTRSDGGRRPEVHDPSSPVVGPVLPLLRRHLARISPRTRAALGAFPEVFDLRKHAAVAGACAVAPGKLPWALGTPPMYPLDLRQRPASYLDALRVIAGTPVGRELLELSYRRGMPAIRPLTDATRRKLGVNPNAAATYWMPESTIFVGTNEELGLLAINLFHELVHSLDDRYRIEAEKAQRLRTRWWNRMQEVLARTGGVLREPELTELNGLQTGYLKSEVPAQFKTERLAYDGEFIFKAELAEAHRCVFSYLAAQIANGATLPFMSDEAIIRGYDLQREYLKPMPIGAGVQ